MEKTNIFQSIAIVIAGIIVAGAIILTNKIDKIPEKQNADKSSAATILPVDAKDVIRGNPKAPIVIIEYSDLECPFCKTFHGTMEKIFAEYGGDGKIAWVFRHMPIGGLHPKAQTEHEAAECVRILKGDEAFWNFIEKVFEITPSNNGLDLAILPTLAKEQGVSEEEFATCMNEKKGEEKVNRDFESGKSAGVKGTPTSFAVSSKATVPMVGAQSLNYVKSVIDTILSAK